MVLGERMIVCSELGRIWKEAVVAYLKCLVDVCMEDNHEVSSPQDWREEKL